MLKWLFNCKKQRLIRVGVDGLVLLCACVLITVTLYFIITMNTKLNKNLLLFLDWFFLFVSFAVIEIALPAIFSHKSFRNVL